MTYRITEKDLKNMAANINSICGLPDRHYTRDSVTNKLTAHIGHFYIQAENQSFYLRQVCTEGGGCSNWLFGNTKRELYGKLQAMYEGLRLGKTCERHGIAKY